ncbi:pyridoxamine 5'-phosphate oxidase family protein [Psychroflexus montanilacus]|uniref:pyridoxamine 5'-phosphate oxidase family protein n=1 Tax=Psychroflexus montanilacus TaxID=2873598 RepID=UPI001CCA6A1A|nr:pyridoxamine 5'-phosphate oxidase family protein [Psychroflexus montanilacus]MBZ9651963.1 pyridoxamine 5'-phosphate oxidase family protein [Psychroflexus montanilacus]
MLNQILEDLKNEVKFGYLKKKHPFRYPSLASIEDNVPVQRTVVLRDSTQDFELIMYTDERSDKIHQFEINPNASLLFYNHKKLLQIKVEGKMKLIRSGKDYEDYWSRVQGKSQKDFITTNPPGTPIDNPDHVEYKDDEHHFCLLKLVPERMEYLQLKRPNHIRAVFDKTNNWEGQFLNP